MFSKDDTLRFAFYMRLPHKHAGQAAAAAPERAAAAAECSCATKEQQFLRDEQATAPLKP
jgi:hypothetical protein